MYDPKFTQKQMYDQYGSSRETTKKADPKPSRSSGFGGMGSDPAEQFGGSPTRGIGAKPPSNTFGGGQDNNPNRDEYENKSTVAKVYEKTVDLFKSFGAKEPEALIVDGKRVYQGPLFSGYDPTVRIGPFGGDAGKKQYRFGMPLLGEVSPSYPSPTLPPADNNPTLNMFGVRRGFTGGPDMPELSVSSEAPANMDPMTRVLSQAMLPTEVNYTIQDGDTLSEIARDAGTTVEVLMQMNSIKEEDKDTIFAGDNLKVPVKKLTDTQAALRKGLGSKKDMSGIQVASADPDFKSYQSQVPMDKRIYSAESTYFMEIPQVFESLEKAKPIIAIENSLSDDELGIPDTDNYMGYIPLTPAQRILDKIAVGEGAVAEKLQRQAKHNIGTTDYDMVYNYGDTLAPSKPITQMTIQEVFDYQKKLIKATKGKVPGTTKGTSAVGKYQFIKTSLFGANGTPEKPEKNRWADKLKLTPDMIFTPALQEKIGRLALKETGFNNYLKGKKSQAATIDRIANIWASVEGNTYNQGTATTKAELASILDTVQPDYYNLGTP